MEITDIKTCIEIFKNVKLGESIQITDNNLIYQYVDEAFRKFIGCDTVGKRLREIDTMFSDHVSSMKSVPDTMFQNKISHLVYIIKVSDNVESYFIELKLNAVYNTVTGEPLGLVVVTHKIENNNSIIQLFSTEHFKKKDFVAIINQDHEKTKNLDIRSYEILTLLAMHKTFEEISEILSKIYKQKIGKATLITHTRRYLHTYFDVINTKDLIHKAASLNYLDYIPSTLHSVLLPPPN